MSVGRPFTVTHDYTESFSFKKCKKHIMFNPAMITLVEIKEYEDG